jgi:divalent metal cation (Fe/Co/Zn/Cd) transporter
VVAYDACSNTSQAMKMESGSKMAKARTKIIIRRAWTKDDVRQMKTMAKAKSGVKKIAKALKRTPGATTVMAAKLGVSLSMRD